jgi:hypothetical protein
MGYKVFIRDGKAYSEPIKYVLSVIAHNQQIKFNIIHERTGCDLIFDDEDAETPLTIATDFYQHLIIDQLYSYQGYFKNDCSIRNSTGSIDHIATIFYMINCFQEYTDEISSYDKFGRFSYFKSYQYNFDVISENLVQKNIEAFCLTNLKQHPIRQVRSRVFISHDIDTIYGSFLQDGFWALKNNRIDVILKLILNFILLKPEWKNMDRIMKINDEYSIKSTFFWLASKGKGLDGIKNADYDPKTLKPLMSKIETNGFYNGIHKSCTSISLNDEINNFPLNVNINRHHFLKFKLPNLWDQISNSTVQADFSLGFAEHYGFRNNYGLPFRPYNLNTKKPYPIIEVPLNLMDSTFSRYLKIPALDTAREIISFFEKNKYNCIISLLWHNTYFSEYKYHGYLQQYRLIMEYLFEMKIEHVTPPQIINEFNYGE